MIIFLQRPLRVSVHYPDNGVFGGGGGCGIRHFLWPIWNDTLSSEIFGLKIGNMTF